MSSNSSNLNFEEYVTELKSKNMNRNLAIQKVKLNFDLTDEHIIFFIKTFPSHLENLNPSNMSRSDKISFIQEKILFSLSGNYLVYRDHKGDSMILRRNPKTDVVNEISLTELQSQVSKLFAETIYDCGAQENKDRTLSWIDRVDHLKELPPSFRWKNDRGLCFNRLDFEIADVPTPLFDELLSRVTSNREALCAFIWSIFEPTSRSQTYLWMYGQGGDGKGTLTHFLEKILGQSFVALHANNKYWLADCVGKRLGVFNDTVNTTVPLSSQFKQVTGGDAVCIEQKYQKAYTARLEIKFIFTTNKDIALSSQRSDLRRSIIVKFAENDSELRANYEDDFWAERAGILHKCREIYHKISNKGTIPFDLNVAMEAADEFEVKFDSIFNTTFYLSPESKILRADVYISVNELLGNNNKQFSEFKDWMKRTHKVTEEKHFINGKVTKYYVGIDFRGRKESIQDYDRQILCIK